MQTTQPDPKDPKIKQLVSEGAEEKFAEKMKDIALKEKEQETQMQAFALGIPYISLYAKPISPGALSIISEQDAKRLKVVCFSESAGEKRVACIDPDRKGLEEFLKELEKKTNCKISLFLMSEASLESVLKLYSQLPKVREEIQGVALTQEEFDHFTSDEFSDIRTLDAKLKGVSITDLYKAVIAAALKSRASDIHIEAEEKDIKVRYRVDGILHTVATLPREVWKQVISRLKLFAELKINITDKPQDGRFTIGLAHDKVDVRVSTLPTSEGESVVMRLLRSSSAGLDLPSLGLSPYSLSQLKKEIEKPNGMIMTTGPTGSGKTTTLYAILNHLNSQDIKIITLEDPVEYKLAGISQSQIDASKGYTFAGGLRSILRQDPDIVMVGEIRDLETADIAVNAALTGHLVLSTIHTNSAAGAVPRFLAMGAKSYLLAPALNAVMGQRLVRRLCAECKKEVQLDPAELERVKTYLSTITPKAGILIDLANLHFWDAQGCPACNGLGYKGRIGVYEIMGMNQEIEAVVLSEQVSEYKMEEIAIKNGMVTMVQDGLLRALEGVTSVKEVFSVAQ
ncbi:type II/IV secretion system protein [Candidatus Uhrbacteria bacterium]|nr:type II/IV secretion system protein [Candidatus Uhrbacteria bacterium]